MVKAVRAIVHKKADAKEAYGIFLREKDKDKSVGREAQKVIKTVGRSTSFD
jgi:hypothetical protein